MEPVIHQIETKSVITKTDVPVCDYAVNPYVGCTHGCKYCYIREKHPELVPLYREIYTTGSRRYWETLDAGLRGYAESAGLLYVRDDDSMQQPFDASPVIVNYFYHEEVKKSAKKDR